MIHIEPGHRIVAEAIKDVLASETKYAIDVSAADHNDVMYKLFSDPDAPHVLTVSVRVSCFEQVAEQVGMEWFRQRYGQMLLDRPEEGFSLSLELDLEALAGSSEAQRDDVVNLVSCLRRDIEGAPLWVCFSALLYSRPVPRPFYATNPRPREAMYVVPAADRIVVVFVLAFDDSTEQSLASTFLQEIEVVRRNEKSLATAPIVSFNARPPLELQSLNIKEMDAPLGYLSIAVDKRHLDGSGRLEKAVGLVASYRSYVMYHVKCTKSNMHSRMRSNVNSWLQVLNRAVPDKIAAEKKTISGRTFKRAGTRGD
mmetsp:Transcript_78/g.310  ORF Transcript_78/g.310 Transcript_78/m.310 type:complete len:312 (-) Transcript_78:242-1177(-)